MRYQRKWIATSSVDNGVEKVWLKFKNQAINNRKTENPM